MNEDPFRNLQSAPASGDQEKLKPRTELAREDDWRTCKELRILSITGPDAEMMGATPEVLQRELNKSDEEWKKETESREMFSVLSYIGTEAVGLGRVRLEKGFGQYVKMLGEYEMDG